MKKLFFFLFFSILISCNNLSKNNEWALATSSYMIEKDSGLGYCVSMEFFNKFQKKNWDYKTKMAYSPVDEKSVKIKYADNIRMLNKTMFLSYYNQSKCHFYKWKDEFVNQNNSEKAYHLNVAKKYLEYALDIFNNDKKALECSGCEYDFQIGEMKDFLNELKQY